MIDDNCRYRRDCARWGRRRSVSHGWRRRRRIGHRWGRRRCLSSCRRRCGRRSWRSTLGIGRIARQSTEAGATTTGRVTGEVARTVVV